MPNSLITPVARNKAGLIPVKGVNAWIPPREDEPKGTTYSDPTSCFQSLIRNGVYRSIDLLSICWCHTVPTSLATVPPGSGTDFTISMGTTLQYTQWLIRDSRACNPAIKGLVMLFYGTNEIATLFPLTGPSLEVQYAQNVLTFLKTYQLDGFDVDWEQGIEGGTTAQQFKQTFMALRQAFDAEEQKTGKHYYLVISPSGNGNLDTGTVNTCFDWVTLQNYWYVNPSDFPGITLNLFQFGAQFEEGNGIWNTTQSAYQGFAAGPNPPSSGPYQLVTQWRFNSANFQYEQAQQMILYVLVYGVSGGACAWRLGGGGVRLHRRVVRLGLPGPHRAIHRRIQWLDSRRAVGWRRANGDHREPRCALCATARLSRRPQTHCCPTFLINPKLGSFDTSGQLQLALHPLNALQPRRHALVPGCAGNRVARVGAGSSFSDSPAGSNEAAWSIIAQSVGAVMLARTMPGLTHQRALLEAVR